MTAYKNLELWKKSMELVKNIYLLTRSFPKEEIYTLTAQIKRAVISVPSNIAEGLGRNYKKETIQFLHIARGSLYETDTQLCIANMINILSSEELMIYTKKIDECHRMLNGLISYYEKSDLK